MPVRGTDVEVPAATEFADMLRSKNPSSFSIYFGFHNPCSGPDCIQQVCGWHLFSHRPTSITIRQRRYRLNIWNRSLGNRSCFLIALCIFPDCRHNVTLFDLRQGYGTGCQPGYLASTNVRGIGHAGPTCTVTFVPFSLNLSS